MNVPDRPQDTHVSCHLCPAALHGMAAALRHLRDVHGLWVTEDEVHDG